MMSRTDFDRFVADLNEDRGLWEEFAALGDPSQWVERAGSKGYRLSQEEAAGLAASCGALSDDDLEQVAGGWDSGEPPPDGGGG